MTTAAAAPSLLGPWGIVPDLLGLAFAGWLLVGRPVAGRRDRALAGALTRRPGGRLGCYRAAIRRLVLGAAVGALLLGLGRAAAPLPDLAGLPRPLLAGLGVAALVALALPGTAPAPARALLPDTPLERRLFGVVALAAATAEEVAYRAFLPGMLLLVLPGLGTLGAVLVATAAFAAAHAYQGPVGMVRAAAVGLALAGVYAATGVLLASIVAHALVDLRLVFLTRPASGPRRSQQRPGSSAGLGSGGTRWTGGVPAAVAGEVPAARRA